jgi:hypothetical protein
MRDLTKSMMSYGWAMSVFGLQQMVNLMTPGQSGDPCGKAAKAFNDVTQATTDTLDSSLKAAYDAGNNMQSGVIDMMFGGFMAAGMDPGRWMRMGNEALQSMGTAGMQAAQAAAGAATGTTRAAPGASQAPTGSTGSSSSGWGPMPH